MLQQQQHPVAILASKLPAELNFFLKKICLAKKAVDSNNYLASVNWYVKENLYYLFSVQ